jgi:hypothetical protein
MRIDAAKLFDDDNVISGFGRPNEERTVKSRMNYNIRKLDTSTDEMIVTGEVYAPYVIDSHGDMMLPEDVKLLAFRFLENNRNHFIDLMHNNKAVQACVVESFIARPGDPDYAEGAWVLTLRIYDQDLWEEIKAGKWNGYSLEAMVYKVPAVVEYEYVPLHLGITEDGGEEDDLHDHVFYVQVAEDGRVIGGTTSPAPDGHVHDIKAGTATEIANDHQHRYFLNEID